MLSPTAINTYLFCPRKFYRRYILKEPSRPSIYLIRGLLVHRVLSDFHKNQPSVCHKLPLSMVTHTLVTSFEKRWDQAGPQLKALPLSSDQVAYFNQDSKRMLVNFAVWFCKKGARPADFSEMKLFSSTHKLMGIVDAVHKEKNQVMLVDYKTSKKAKITRDMFRQAAIYALLYQERFKQTPEAVGIHFLTDKDGMKPIYIDEPTIEYAKIVTESVHEKTVSDNAADYPCTCNGRCEKDFT
jgi:CRISPR/Cas system-associated exonuclease Cas4 (RecB family)